MENASLSMATPILSPKDQFDLLTNRTLLYHNNPATWYDRAVMFIFMGYPDHAIYDITRAYHLIKRVCDADGCKFISAVTLKVFPFEAAQQLYCEIVYTFAYTLFACRFKSQYITMCKSVLDMVLKIPYDENGFVERVQNIQRQCDIVCNQLFRSDEDVAAYDRSIKFVDRIMINGRYPWDTSDSRGLPDIQRRYNDMVQTYALEVKFSIQRNGLQAGIFAKTPIRAGNIVITETPSVVVNTRSRNVCEHCGTICIHIVRCQECQIAYCSDRCRVEANTLYHIILCGDRERVFKRSFAAVCAESYLFPMMIVKLFAMSIVMKVSVLELPCIQPLRPWSPSDMNSKSYVVIPYISDYYQITCDVFDVTMKFVLHFDYHIYETLCRIVIVNGFSIFDGETQTGMQLYQTISWINHSCKPNCCRSGNYLKTKRAINAGEELTIAYVNPGKSYLNRKHELKTIFGLECMCSECRQ
ncbi:hypothetical protein BC938DRAFT_483542 [Jimgerdemannia flammicorona]|uniref:SET domain-containing protein n=1 Tax=Jimgerdemannia flammicorona TaxID=994334 RepID=A0A433R0B4_9FUNG|nr:hypothetical protein BC938DRAFT_483542 [Jimgerdemannia flammicorona]